jgi:hypothetical protein
LASRLAQVTPRSLLAILALDSCRLRRRYLATRSGDDLRMADARAAERQVGDLVELADAGERRRHDATRLLPGDPARHQDRRTDPRRNPG